MTDKRTKAASGLRQLSHAMVSHELSTETLEEITAFTERMIPIAEAGDERDLGAAFLKDPKTIAAMQSGDLASLLVSPDNGELFSNSIVSGRENPLGIAAKYVFTDHDVSTTITLGKAYEGAPGMVHGGIIAAIADETMGAVLTLEKVMAFTGQLILNYRSPTPVGAELTFTARLEKRSGRKLWIECTVVSRDVVLVEAEGLFIALAL